MIEKIKNDLGENMLNTIKIYFLLFLIYSFLGWCMEVICSLVERKKFVNRGFLIGPYCPIYGCGALLITFLLKDLTHQPILLFIITVLLCGTLEYITSFLMEKIFHLRWWDYSHKKVNIHGRVCLDTVIPFGILGVIILYVSNPILIEKLQQIPPEYLTILVYSLFAVFVIDNIISLTTILGIRNTTNRINRENTEDNTEEITKKVREILLGKSFVQRRIFDAYPRLQAIKIKVKEKIDQTKDELEKQKRILDRKVKIAQHEINRKIKKVKKKKE